MAELQFHLYLNAFKNTKSTFMKESGGQLRGDQMAEDSWGWIDVTSMKIAAGADLKPTLAFIQPDDGNADDQTVAKVALPEPVPPGGSVTLDIAFTSQLPQVFARTGYKDDFYLVGQWFPKLGVYEPAGMRGRAAGGWNCHQFHANSEFYADYGAFRVEITVPTGYVVGATACARTSTRTATARRRYTYEQADVHDFAWTADPDYVVVKATFSATKDVTPAEYERIAKLLGRTLDEVRLSDVEITVLLQPDHRPQAQRHIDAAKAGLKWFGLWYGRYPYKTLTVVDPAPGASGAGGMEYPTFITAGTAWLLNYWPFDRIRMVEEVTVHEFGHQFWYAHGRQQRVRGGVARRGHQHLLDRQGDGGRLRRERTVIDFLGITWATRTRRGRRNDPDGSGTTGSSPGRGTTCRRADVRVLLLQKAVARAATLEGYLGEQTMARVMRTYHERWRFRHPRSEDFFALVNEVTGQDWSWFFDQVVRGTDILDYEIGSATSEPVLRPPACSTARAAEAVSTAERDEGRRRGRP